MKQVAFTELRNHAKQYFDPVESGEPFGSCATASQ
ncbi:MAG: type II toxin-antitoxin system Phd/YefM family antitoxin [Acidithiobacillus sp.]|jgi:antitoxin (DNA-binding transcriptional repressor) of toxin-antitoxin stability system|nr:type II toxin-antitoxin system Phd/YefM family antitoxin [Acidithiobacillus sp.]MCK9359952.1 type II toxin-antitoxin system Phd/YefM family antitoxin [Acidithiobacillus sp.]